MKLARGTGIGGALAAMVERYGEEAVFVGHPEAQAALQASVTDERNLVAKNVRALHGDIHALRRAFRGLLHEIGQRRADVAAVLHTTDFQMEFPNKHKLYTTIKLYPHWYQRIIHLPPCQARLSPFL